MKKHLVVITCGISVQTTSRCWKSLADLDHARSVTDLVLSDQDGCIEAAREILREPTWLRNLHSTRTLPDSEALWEQFRQKCFADSKQCWLLPAELNTLAAMGQCLREGDEHEYLLLCGKENAPHAQVLKVLLEGLSKSGAIPDGGPVGIFDEALPLSPNSMSQFVYALEHIWSHLCRRLGEASSVSFVMTGGFKVQLVDLAHRIAQSTSLGTLDVGLYYIHDSDDAELIALDRHLRVRGIEQRRHTENLGTTSC